MAGDDGRTGTEANARPLDGVPPQAAGTEAAGGRRDDAWASSGRHLRVLGEREGAINLNVEGRDVTGPLQGFGRLWQKTFRVRLEGAALTPAEVVALWKREFPSFQPDDNRFYPSLSGIAPGEVVLINARTPGGTISTGVMVLYADDESFSLMTPEGHPESGWVTFSAADDAGTVVAQVQTMARANDPLYEVAFRLIGSRVQDRIWTHVLSALAERLEVAPRVEVTRSLVDPRLQWRRAGNIRHNAQIRTLLYGLAAPFRRRPTDPP